VLLRLLIAPVDGFSLDRALVLATSFLPDPV